jgi:hypothetical protein
MISPAANNITSTTGCACTSELASAADLADEVAALRAEIARLRDQISLQGDGSGPGSGGGREGALAMATDGVAKVQYSLVNFVDGHEQPLPVPEG